MMRDDRPPDLLAAALLVVAAHAGRASRAGSDTPSTLQPLAALLSDQTRELAAALRRQAQDDQEQQTPDAKHSAAQDHDHDQDEHQDGPGRLDPWTGSRIWPLGTVQDGWRLQLCRKPYTCALCSQPIKVGSAAWYRQDLELPIRICQTKHYAAIGLRQNGDPL